MGPQRDTLTGFEAGECVELTNTVMRVGVHVASGELISILSKRTRREHLLVRLLRGDIPHPMALADAGSAPPPGSWRLLRKTRGSVTLAGEDRGLRFIRTVRLLPNGMAEVRTTVAASGTGKPPPVQFAFRAPLVPGGGGIHGHTNTSHFGHRLFILTDSGLVEQGHRKYSNSRYEWAYPKWAAFVDTVRKEGVAFLFESVTPVIIVRHDWNEMLVDFRSAWGTPRRGKPAEFAYRVCVFDGVTRVDRLDEAGLAAIDVPATIAPGETVKAQASLISFRPRRGTATIGWEGDGEAHVKTYRAQLEPYRPWRRRVTLGPFPDPIDVKYNEYVSKPALVWVSVGRQRAERHLADTPSITSAPVQTLRISALTGRVRRTARDLVDRARAEHKAGRLPREGLAVCLVYQRFLEKQMREEAWTEDGKGRAFRWLEAMRAAAAAASMWGSRPRLPKNRNRGRLRHIAGGKETDPSTSGALTPFPRIVPDADEMKAMLADPVTGRLLRAYAERAAKQDQDVPLGATKLRLTWGPNYFYPFTAAQANAVAHAITGDRTCLKRATRDMLKIARNHLIYGSCLGESLFIATRMLGLLEAFDVVQPHLTLQEETDVLDHLLWCAEIFFDDVNLTGSNHDSWHANALGWLAHRFAYLPQARLWAERCAAILRHHVNYQLADGAWNEQSPTYHDMNVRSFVLGVEALRGLGFDLYRSEDAKSIQAMACWSIAMAGPERTYSPLDDSRGGSPSLDAIILAATAYRDPELLGYAVSQIEAGAGIGEPLAIWRYPRDLKPANPTPLYASLLPASGHVVFRSVYPAEDTGGQAASGTRCAASGTGRAASGTPEEIRIRGILQYGPHGGWHGHYDKLAFDLMIDGEPALVDAGAALYEDAVHWTWHRTTRAHNTVLVDGKSQHACTGRLLAHRELKRSHLAVVEAETYPGVVHERAVLDVGGQCIVVLDRLRSDRPHKYALLWHGAGCLALCGSTATFSADGASATTVVVPGAKLVADVGPVLYDRKAPYVQAVQRRRRNAEFLTVIAPFAKADEVSVIRPSGADGHIVIERAGRHRIEVRIDRRRAAKRLVLK